MKKRIAIYVSLSIICLIVIALFIYLSTFVQPKIFVSAEITKVSDKDYKRIINNTQVMYPSKDIEKFKSISIQISVVEPIGINNHIKIEKDTLKQYLKDNKNILILDGGSFEHGNEKEYSENMEVYLINLSENELKNILEDFSYKISWTDLWNKQNSNIFYLKDYLNVAN